MVKTMNNGYKGELIEMGKMMPLVHLYHKWEIYQKGGLGGGGRVVCCDDNFGPFLFMG